MAAINTYPDAALPLTGAEAMIGTQSGATVQLLVSQLGTYIGATLDAAGQGNLTAPANTTTYFMQGLNGNLTYTPTKSGKISVRFDGTIVSPTGTAAGNGILLQASWGNGTAPVNGGNLAGNQFGAITQYTNPATVTAADVHIPFTNGGVITGAIGTPIWFDQAAKSVATASDMGISAVHITVTEL